MTHVGVDQDLLADDEEHALPYVSRLDVAAKFPDGRVKLSIVIADPMVADERSHERLLSKIESYLAFMSSADYEKQFGKPSRETTSIEVRIHKDSAVYFFELLDRCVDWVAKSNATLEVVRI